MRNLEDVVMDEVVFVVAMVNLEDSACSWPLSRPSVIPLHPGSLLFRGWTGMRMQVRR